MVSYTKLGVPELETTIDMKLIRKHPNWEHFLVRADRRSASAAPILNRAHGPSRVSTR